MEKHLFDKKIEALPVFDAHTHLIGPKLRAADFWEIVHYFWFLRELTAAGYPSDYDSMPENVRIPHFLAAFHKTASTAMNYSVRRIFKDLYDIEITDGASVRDANERVKASNGKTGWQKEVAAKGHIRRAIVNKVQDKDFEGIAEVGLLLPRIDGPLHNWASEIHQSDKKRQAAEKCREQLDTLITGFHSQGTAGIMTTINTLTKKTGGNGHKNTAFADYDDCLIFMLHSLCAIAEQKGLAVQFFLGIGRDYGRDAAPINRTDRVLNLYGLFEGYQCPFDLVMGSEINTMDVVQASVIFPHVTAGGLWWYNFRPSSFHDSMAKRFEALPSCKSYLAISDARCIEWCYGKNVLIKKLVADFLWQKIGEGWINEPAALKIAEDWLNNTPDKLYGKSM